MEDTNTLPFALMACFTLAMALVYLPLRLHLSFTHRSRRLRLLRRIRNLREELRTPQQPPVAKA
ncbi:MAG: hypothetical protein ERJ67_02410 [Aphanocapsa feldmannii 277cV]|uniref:Uncharacterized protein n=2 Tax=Aphanocapsa feldmannii TaxID=192050 RepID=A0A524RPZ8_9CHRO|nr:MAG: hypothetical protein ERJ69_00855 [Aphanocapsa feldmannii 288cV]TGG94485.1 MAG: hypothetical protein ERJ67_02410 [Aphanocapsa feldmannii 277cV]TGH24554.1 MAG: hypothetical protein ERJ68_03175 [Aphanocapsa feldmannii 277cI]